MQDGKLIYENKLSCEKDVEGFVLEAAQTFRFRRESCAWRTH